MLLIEKPIRIGDLVEIDGVLGTVTSIGIRFSTIQGAQGNDALIPNSVLVEQKLVNWTYSTRDARKDVRVTVSYKSSVERVRNILAQVSAEHPQVKQVPAPVITLEDFGDNGLVFNLQFWINLQAGTMPGQILSDLRISILAAFAEAGIELPFPQRAVIFDQSNPIAVQIQAPSTPAP
jgi:small-conductance mechanosensitive channel